MREWSPEVARDCQKQPLSFIGEHVAHFGAILLTLWTHLSGIHTLLAVVSLEGDSVKDFRALEKDESCRRLSHSKE